MKLILQAILLAKVMKEAFVKIRVAKSVYFLGKIEPFIIKTNPNANLNFEKFQLCHFCAFRPWIFI